MLNSINLHEIKQDFRELNLTIITSVGLGISLGIIGEIVGILIGGKIEYLYLLLLTAFILISITLIFFIYWWSLPKVKIRDFIGSVAIYDSSTHFFLIISIRTMNLGLVFTIYQG